MTTIMTPFEVGETVFTINRETMKILEFVITNVSTVTTEHGTSVFLYRKDDFHAHVAELCFHSREELIASLSE